MTPQFRHLTLQNNDGDSGSVFSSCSSPPFPVVIRFSARVFQAGKYDESLKHLEGLQELNKEDYKISMNEAIVKFYKSGQTTTGALKQSLTLLKNQVPAGGEVLRRPSGLLLTGASVFALQVHTTADDADGLDDVENSLLYYNQAIIHYYLRQFSEAISIGERLYQFLEPFGRSGYSLG